MRINYQTPKNTRSKAIRDGLLLDISPVARSAFIEVPMAISPGLWRALADDAPLRLEDPRLLSLCWTLLLTIVTTTATRQEFLPFCHTLWWEAQILDRRVKLKLITHAGDGPGPVMTVLEHDEDLSRVGVPSSPSKPEPNA